MLRASSQLNSAVRAPPMCRAPVGDGAKRTLMIRARGRFPALQPSTTTSEQLLEVLVERFGDA